MYVDEVLARRRAPMPDYEGLDVRQLQRLLEQRVVIEINLADGKIVGCTPEASILPSSSGVNGFSASVG